jgi:hypothetical protein
VTPAHHFLLLTEMVTVLSHVASSSGVSVTTELLIVIAFHLHQIVPGPRSYGIFFTPCNHTDDADNDRYVEGESAIVGGKDPT